MPILQPSARQGYIGSVVIFGTSVRALSSSLKAEQKIQMPDVVDHRIDRTLYQLGAVEVGGDITLPVVQEGGSSAFLDLLWSWCVTRDGTSGELINSGDVSLNYSYDIGRTFQGCRVDKLNMKMTAGQRVDATVTFFGTTAIDGVNHGNPVSLSPARVLTWNDVEINGPNFAGCIVKEFSFDIMNNLSRNYTFCGSQTGLYASNISTGKRHVQGSLMFQGFAPTDPAYAELNSQRCTSDVSIDMALGGSCGGGFNKSFRNIIFEYQDISIQPSEIITSTVNWYAFGSAGGPAVE